MSLFWQISVVMLNQIVSFVAHRLACKSTIYFSATTSLSATHIAVGSQITIDFA